MDNVKGGQIESFRTINLTAAKKNLSWIWFIIFNYESLLDTYISIISY